MIYDLRFTISRVAVFALLSSCILQPSSSHAQGALTPPGAPAPIFKTLDEVKPGTPISVLPFTITNSGVYFLTKSLTTTGPGVTINSSDVALDLSGFTLTGNRSGNGVLVNTGDRVVVHNGTIGNFGNGIFIPGPATNMLIEDIFAYSNANNGILIVASSSAIQHCRAAENGFAGFNLSGGYNNLFRDCAAVKNNAGFLVSGTNNLVIGNLSSGNSSDFSVGPSNRVGTIVQPALTTGSIGSGGPGSGTTDPFANLRY